MAESARIAIVGDPGPFLEVFIQNSLFLSLSLFYSFTLFLFLSPFLFLFLSMKVWASPR